MLGLIIFLSALGGVLPDDIIGKTTVGYQGWFAAKGDGSPINCWWHWANDCSEPPSTTNNGIKAWPDMREYTSSYQTNFSNLNGGGPAELFSSFNDQTVNIQFQWMQQNNINTAALQRFNPTGGEGPVRNAITAKVKTAAETYGVKFYIMYDVSGWTNMQTEIKTDWTTLMQNYTQSSAYAKQNGKPVICIWGFGFNDSNHNFNTSQCLDVISFFKNQGLYVIGGVPTRLLNKTTFCFVEQPGPNHWRTQNGDSFNNFISVYNAFDMLSPWMVGRIGTSADSDNFYTNVNVPDLQYCRNHSIAYQPCVLPGDLSARQRVHGDFMWRQFYNMAHLAPDALYISMYDEFNEGNQIVKTADTQAIVPAGSGFLSLDEDGTSCSSDYYLRLTGDGNRMFQGQLPITASRPTQPENLNGAKVTFKSSQGLYVSSNIVSGGPLTADRTSAGAWETFNLIVSSSGYTSLNINLTWNGVPYDNYVSSENGIGPISVNRTAIGSWESFRLYYNTDGTVSLMGNNGLYVTSNNGTGPMTCNKTSIGSWGSFTLTQVG